MVLTTENRMLLEGDEKRGTRGLPKRGWFDACTAPPRFAARIVECRMAELEGRPIPPLSAEYIAQAEIEYRAHEPERRAQVMQFEQKLLPTRRITHAIFRSVPAGTCLEDHRDARQIVALRAKAQRLSAIISADNRAAEQRADEQRDAEKRAEQEREIRNMRREMFPWERND